MKNKSNQHARFYKFYRFLTAGIIILISVLFLVYRNISKDIQILQNNQVSGLAFNKVDGDLIVKGRLEVVKDVILTNIIDSIGEEGNEGNILVKTDKGVVWKDPSQLPCPRNCEEKNNALTTDTKVIYNTIVKPLDEDYLRADTTDTFSGQTLIIGNGSSLDVKGSFRVKEINIDGAGYLTLNPVAPAANSLYWGNKKVLLEGDVSSVSIQDDGRNTLLVNQSGNIYNIGINLSNANTWTGLQIFQDLDIDDDQVNFLKDAVQVIGRTSLAFGTNSDTTMFLDLVNKKLGIGTTTPVFGITMYDNSSGILSRAENFSSTDSMPSLNTSAAMMYWYPKKYAFGAGYFNNIGDSNIGTGSVIFGRANSVRGSYSMSSGQSNTVSGSGALAIGSGNTLTGSNSIVLGVNNRLYGSGSIMAGYNSYAYGNYALIVGTNCSGDNNSVSAGYNSFATYTSVAIGYNTRANGSSSIALGYRGYVASNYGAAIGGYHPMVYGREAFVTGHETIAESYLMAVFGRYNVTNSNWHDSLWYSNEPLFVVGNGASASSRSNALTILKNGNTGIKTANPTYALQVGNSGDGTRAIANAWQTFSDKRFKKNIKVITNAIDKLARIRGVFFDWKGSGEHSIGFIAQEIKDVLPEVVYKDSNGYYSVDYSKVTPLLVEALKEEHEQLLNLKQKLEEVTLGITEELVHFIHNLSHAIEVNSQGVISFVEKVIFQKDVYFKGRLVFGDSDMGGYVTIPAGQKGVHVTFRSKYDKTPVIVVTPVDKYSQIFVKNITVQGFDIVIEGENDTDQKVAWQAILVK